MKDDQFTQLFKYMSQRFDSIESTLAVKADKKDTDRIYDVIDSFTKQLEIEEHERLAISRQVSRHEQWHGQIARKLNVRLDHTS